MFLFYIKKNGISYQLASQTLVSTEGTDVVVSLQTVGVAVGTIVPYTLSGTGITPADFGLASLNGSFVVAGDILAGTSSVTLGVVADHLTEGVESAMLMLDNGRSYVNFSITDTSKTPSYLLSASATSTNEGGSIVYTLTTGNVADGTTVDYNIAGTASQADYTGLATGSFVVYNNTATFTLPVTADELTEGTETITVALTNGNASVSVTIVDTSKTKSYALSTTSATVNEGTDLTITLTTENVSNSATIPYTITGVTSADISGASLTGNFVVNANTASVTLNITADNSLDGVKNLKLTLDNSQSTQVTVQVNDTSYPTGYTLTSSVSPANEGTDVTITLTTLNIASGTIFPYTITGINSADVGGSSLAGVFTIDNNTAVITHTIAADNLTEGNETLTLALDGGHASISIVLVDTSKTKTYTLSADHTTVDEGTTAVVTLTTENVVDGTVIPYTITGIVSDDISGGGLSGSFTIVSNTASRTLNFTNDLVTEGTESVTVVLDGGLGSLVVTINDTSRTQTFTLVPSLTSVNEGTNVTFTLTTANVADATNLGYTITGISSVDIGGQSLTGNLTIVSNTASTAFLVTADALTEGNETLTFVLDNGKASSAVTIVDTSRTPAFALSRSAASVNEGDTAIITLTTTNVNDGVTIPYTIVGISSADVGGASLTGVFTVLADSAILSLNVATDVLLEGPETLTLTLDQHPTTNVSIGIVDTSYPIGYTLISSINPVDEGSSVTVILTTLNIPNGTVLPYTITGISSVDIEGAALTGSFTVNANTASAVYNITADNITEGTETFTLALDNGNATTAFLINDTSRTKTYALSTDHTSANEGSTVIITLTTENVVSGTVLPYTITGISSADIGGAALTGSLTISSNTASVLYTFTNDLLTEGAEVMALTLDGGLGSVSVIINDTSLTQTFNLAPSLTSMSEGTNVTFTLTTANVPDNTNLGYVISGTGVTTTDISGQPLTGTLTVLNNTATLTYLIVADALTEGDETLTVALDNGKASSSVTIVDTSKTPTYALSRSGASVDESGQLTLTLATTNVVDNTLIPYTIAGTGIVSADFGGIGLSGNFVILGGTSLVTLNVTADQLTEGAETATLSLTNGMGSIAFTIVDTSQVPTYVLSRSVTNVNEGSSVTITLTTTSVFDNTLVPYTISGTGITSADINGASLTGNFIVVGNTASLTLNLTLDELTEGNETLTIALNSGASTISVIVNDTSVTKTYSLMSNATNGTVYEGSTVIITLTTTGIANATLIPYTISGAGITSADINGASLTGNFTVNGNAATLSLTVTVDGATEGTESMALSLNGGLGSITISLSDPAGTLDLAKTVLFLKGDGTNNAQNNTFIDSSSNNLTVTRYGNPTQGTFTPWSSPIGEWSVFFGGASQSVTIAPNVLFGFDTGDFTVEGWIFPQDTSINKVFVDMRDAVVISDRVALLYTTSNQFAYYHLGANRITSTAVTAGVWHHVALTHAVGITRLFVDGIQQGANYSNTGSKGTSVGVALTTADIYSWVGYISNVRIIKYAVYTTNFTPSTTPLPSTVNGVQASLLVFQTNKFEDLSGNKLPLTINGTPSVSAFSSFAHESNYDPIAHGGSAYFNSADGTPDYLLVANHPNLIFGSNSFTIEMWVYPLSTNNTVLFSKRPLNSTNAGCVIYMSTRIQLFVSIGGGWAISGAASTTTITPRAWNHVAVVRNGTTISLYTNGKLGYTTSGVVGSITDVGAAVGVGTDSTAGTGVNSPTCYLSDYTILNGVAKYTSDFTLPTSPATNVIGSTAALLNFTNVGVYDSIKRNDIETVGDVKISTTQSKFGSSSIYFDGDGDYLTVADQPDFDLTAGDFTIDLWIYNTKSTYTDHAFYVVKDNIPGIRMQYGLYRDKTAGMLYFALGKSTIMSGTAVPLNTWFHAAVVRLNSNTTLYFNGVAKGSVLDAAPTAGTAPLYIGADPAYTITSHYQGYLANVRIVKGKALFTADFDPAAIVY